MSKLSKAKSKGANSKKAKRKAKKFAEEHLEKGKRNGSEKAQSRGDGGKRKIPTEEHSAGARSRPSKIVLSVKRRPNQTKQKGVPNGRLERRSSLVPKRN
jgi:hypothetical protein